MYIFIYFAFNTNNVKSYLIENTRINYMPGVYAPGFLHAAHDIFCKLCITLFAKLSQFTCNV